MKEKIVRPLKKKPQTKSKVKGIILVQGVRDEP